MACARCLIDAGAAVRTDAAVGFPDHWNEARPAAHCAARPKDLSDDGDQKERDGTDQVRRENADQVRRENACWCAPYRALQLLGSLNPHGQNLLQLSWQFRLLLDNPNEVPLILQKSEKLHSELCNLQ